MVEGPQRIQLRRTKGWRMPENAVKVDRTTMFGNRWKVGVWSNTLGRTVATVEESVDLYRLLAWPEPHHVAWVRENLRGKNLACWCALCPAHQDGKPFGVDCRDCSPCHSDVLGPIANAPLTCEAVSA